MPDEVPVVVPGSERILLQVDHPQFNHDAGTVAFGTGIPARLAIRELDFPSG